ncbi:rifin [Plasmodium reichenowi]|uniref:Rifin n=1 Tax=Plasmodium reichenowi TaxID=5854 RepID=A0A060RQ82_PLARE|nr:rifin [Plasmodium reichenowi]
MKVHYINILLFVLPLNILEHNQRNHYITTYTYINRSLCECELYAPANYDNDSEMKSVMENFNKQTQQRFHEYDDRMVETRKQCKDQCDKEIQKIILKDKIEKELMDKFSTLHTDIKNDAIPTCICEKSLADKMEKGCLKCAQNLGGIVAPSSGVLAGIAEAAISVLKPLALKAATEEAIAEATSAATQAGIEAVKLKIKGLIDMWGKGSLDLTPIVNELNFNFGSALVETAEKLFGEACITDGGRTSSFCNTAIYYRKGDYYVGSFGQYGSAAYDAKLASETPALTKAKVGAVEATYAGWQTAIIASIVAIVVIVLIMVIIYLILHYRRKKKMKKKLQYIKLLKE